MYVAGAAWHALILGSSGQLEVGCTLGNPTLRLPKYAFNLIYSQEIQRSRLTPSLVAGNALYGLSQSLFFVWFLDFQGEVLLVKLGTRAPNMNLHDYPIITPWDRNTPLLDHGTKEHMGCLEASSSPALSCPSSPLIALPLKVKTENNQKT